MTKAWCVGSQAKANISIHDSPCSAGPDVCAVDSACHAIPDIKVTNECLHRPHRLLAHQGLLFQKVASTGCPASCTGHAMPGVTRTAACRGMDTSVSPLAMLWRARMPRRPA